MRPINKSRRAISGDAADGATIDDLIAQLASPNAREGRLWDGRARAGMFRLDPDAEVGIFPPVGGG